MQKARRRNRRPEPAFLLRRRLAGWKEGGTEEAGLCRRDCCSTPLCQRVVLCHNFYTDSDRFFKKYIFLFCLNKNALELCERIM